MGIVVIARSSSRISRYSAMEFALDVIFLYDCKRVALTSEDGSDISYSEMIISADSLTSDISPRSLVFLVCENCPESITAYIGFLRKRTHLIPHQFVLHVPKAALICLFKNSALLVLF